MVTVREKHGGKCCGAPETAPRRFTMEIDLKIGAAQWDNHDEMEMRPIPRALRNLPVWAKILSLATHWQFVTVWKPMRVEVQPA